MVESLFLVGANYISRVNICLFQSMKLHFTNYDYIGSFS